MGIIILLQHFALSFKLNYLLHKKQFDLLFLSQKIPLNYPNQFHQILNYFDRLN
jgi:hypothetical protein